MVDLLDIAHLYKHRIPNTFYIWIIKPFQSSILLGNFGKTQCELTINDLSSVLYRINLFTRLNC